MTLKDALVSAFRRQDTDDKTAILLERQAVALERIASILELISKAIRISR